MQTEAPTAPESTARPKPRAFTLFERLSFGLLMLCGVASGLVGLLAVPTLTSSCSSLTTCSSCVQHAALSTVIAGGVSCYWCPLDDEGSQCHDIGAVATSKCYGVLTNHDCIASPTTSSTCPMLSPDYCPEATPQVRVTKGLMSRPYSTVRVSLVSPAAKLSTVTGFTYSSAFKWVWKTLALSSRLVDVPAPGTPHDVPFTHMHGPANATVRLPKQGDGVAGVVIADPCVAFGLGATPGYCNQGEHFQTAKRIPEMTNALMADGSLSYWATLGDNWYDPKGDISQTLYARYSPAVLSAFNVAIPGNHDYWSLGPAYWPSPWGEQCGNGFMQWNGIDAVSSKHVNGSAPPYDFSVDPKISIGRMGQGQKCVAAQENFNFYSQLGNLAFIGYTGASSYAELEPFFEEACAAVAAEPTVAAVFLLSHWDTAGGKTGGEEDSTTPGAFSRVMNVSGCREFHQVRMLKWVTGHTHCNTVAPYVERWGAEVAGAGFRVSGMGMAADESTCKLAPNGTACPDCDAAPNFGFPIFDSTGGRLRVLYFDTSTDDKYAAALACVQQQGWRACAADHASVWLDTPLTPRRTVVEAAA